MFRAGGKSIATEVGSRKRVHTTWPEDKSELIEEYDLKTHELLLRKRRTPKPLSGPGAWEYLQGEEAPGFKAPPVALEENSRNPQFSRRDTASAFQWRIRNLPYAPDVYSVTVDDDAQQIVVRTTNKKYFKRISVPELDAMELHLEAGRLRWQHAHNTLVVSYTKPDEVRAAEEMEKCGLKSIEGQGIVPAVPGGEPSDCKQQ